MLRRMISIVLLVILLVFGWVVYQNWNTIDAFIHSLGTSVEQTEQELEENKKELQDYIDQEEDIVVRDLTKEEAKALNSGKLTEEEVIDIITGKTDKPKPSTKPVKPDATPKPTPSPEQTTEDNVSRLIAKLYTQKSIYLNKLDDIEAAARNDFENWQGKWPGRQEVKSTLLNKYLPTVADWEKTCDTMVYGILDEIRAELKSIGKDDQVVDTMKKSYLEEKKLKKAYFINRYMD